MTDLPVRNIVFTVAEQGNGQRGQVIGSYTWEADSMVLANLLPEERIMRVLDDVVSIYPEAQESFEGGVAHDWGTDPYAGGLAGFSPPWDDEQKLSPVAAARGARLVRRGKLMTASNAAGSRQRFAPP